MRVSAFFHQEKTLAIQNGKKMNQGQHRWVRVDATVSLAFSSYPSVPEQDYRNTASGVPVLPSGGTTEASSGFNSLEALLQSVSASYVNHVVRP